MAKTLTPEMADQILRELMFGVKSLRQCCESVGITHGDFLLRLREDPTLAGQYALAREIGDDAAHDRLREKLQEKPAMNEHGVDQGWVQWQRLQTDTLKWELSKRWPRKYGDKVEQVVTGFDGGALQSQIEITFVKPDFQPPVERAAIEAEWPAKPLPSESAVMSERRESPPDPNDPRNRDFTAEEWGFRN